MIYLIVWLILIVVIFNVFDNYKKQHTKPKIYDTKEVKFNHLKNEGELSDDK